MPRLKSALLAARSGSIGDIQMARLREAEAKLSGMSFFVDDCADLTPMGIRRRLRRVQREVGPLGIVVVDYLQLMRPDRSLDTLYGEVTEISHQLKRIAMEFSCPLLALCQLNREIERRASPEPLLSDLRDSGAIEQDADVILMLWRDLKKGSENDLKTIIRKNRQGPADVPVNLVFKQRIT